MNGKDWSLSELMGIKSGVYCFFLFFLFQIVGVSAQKNILACLASCYFFSGVAFIFGSSTPLKTNMSLKINGWKMYFLLKWSLFGGHVNFQVEPLNSHVPRMVRLH